MYVPALVPVRGDTCADMYWHDWHVRWHTMTYIYTHFPPQMRWSSMSTCKSADWFLDIHSNVQLTHVPFLLMRLRSVVQHPSSHCKKGKRYGGAQHVGSWWRCKGVRREPNDQQSRMRKREEGEEDEETENEECTLASILATLTWGILWYTQQTKLVCFGSCFIIELLCLFSNWWWSKEVCSL